MCPKPFSWAKNKGKLFLDGKSRGPLLARAALKFAIVEKKVINIFYTRGTVPTYGISYDKDAFDKQIKAPSPQSERQFLFSCLQRFLTKHHICLIACKRSALRDILRNGYR